jgi:predicted nucleic acid-binding protein
LADRCRRKGITVTTNDALIAQLAIERRCRLLTSDGDFQDIAKVVRKLRLHKPAH